MPEITHKTAAAPPPQALEIDFLPARYREQKVKQRTRHWRFVVVAAYLVLLASASVHLLSRQGQVDRDIENVRLERQQITVQEVELAKLEGKLRGVRVQSELLTYLRHPWSPAKVLDETLAELPATLTLQSIELKMEGNNEQKGTLAPQTKQAKADAEKAAAKRLPAERDLEKLRAKYDNLRPVLTISGSTQSPADVHTFLERVRRFGPVAKAEVVSLESVGQDSQRNEQFHVRVTLRPGYGQPGSKFLGAATKSPEERTAEAKPEALRGRGQQ